MDRDAYESFAKGLRTERDERVQQLKWLESETSDIAGGATDPNLKGRKQAEIVLLRTEIANIDPALEEFAP
ncbi:MAG TPA: hypothetical protein VND87_06810 [Stellaceae bacterium]|nr:hypothetical protein [Stellaceae bacterium]